MNKQSRKQVEELRTKLEAIKGDLENFSSEEHDKFDNLPEGLQNSDKGEEMNTAAETLDEAVTYIEEATEAENNTIEQLDNLP